MTYGTVRVRQAMQNCWLLSDEEQFVFCWMCVVVHGLKQIAQGHATTKETV